MVMVTVQKLIAFETMLMTGLTIYTVVFLILQQRKNRLKARLHEDYSAKLFEAILEQPSGEDVKQSMALSSAIEHEVFRDALVELMGQVAGNERAYLVGLYRQFDYTSGDLEMCRSIFWWRRLEGLIRLNALRDTSYFRMIEDLSRDADPAVASAAFLCLSEIPVQNGQSAVIEALPPFIVEKKDLLTVIVKNIMTANGPDYLQNYLMNPELDSEARNKCALVLAQSKSIEALPAVVEYLSGEPSLSTDDLLLIMTSTMDALDREQMLKLFKLAWHPEGRVRAKLLEYAIPMGLAQAWAFARDRDLAVRAVINKFKKVEAA